MKKLFPLLLLLTSCTPSVFSIPPPKEVKITDTTVMVTNFERTSGGSGTIVAHSFDSSSILTNAHVCEVVKGGGLITSTKDISAAVVSYVVSKTHDLCLVYVAKDLGAAAEVATVAPRMYAAARITGHPHLLPNIVTYGHFSDKKIIQVLMGFRDCTPEEMNSEIFCQAFGKLPIIATRESLVVSATIMAGSSGSGIFNDEGYLSAVVFAGSAELSYTFAVPYEYITGFIRELPSLAVEYPVMIFTYKPKISFKQTHDTAVALCNTSRRVKDSNWCKQLKTVVAVVGE